VLISGSEAMKLASLPLLNRRSKELSPCEWFRCALVVAKWRIGGCLRRKQSFMTELPVGKSRGSEMPDTYKYLMEQEAQVMSLT
jgi:hypothetical protein